MCGEWRETTLGEAVDINPPRRATRGSVLPHVAMDDLLVNSRDIASISTKVFIGSGARFRNGDTLLARITPCLENGKTAFVQSLDTDEVSHGSTEFIVMSGKHGVTDSLYVYYVARSSAFREYAIQKMEGTSGRQRVPTDAVARYRVNLPPLGEQRAIAVVLGALDDKIELNRRMNATLEAMARALFKSWFVDFDLVRAKMEGRTTYGMDAATAALFPAAFTDSPLGPIPEGWHVGTIGDIARNRRDGVLPSEVTPGTRYIGLEHMPRGSVSLGESGQPEDVTSTKMRFDAWDVLFGRLRPYFKKVGVPGFAGICSADIAVVQPKESYDFGLLLCALSDQAFIDYTDRVSNGAKMPRVGWSDMARYEVPIAPAPILGAFDSNVRDFVRLIHSNVEQLETLAAIRDALLPKLLSGAVRIRDAMRAAETTSLVRREMVTHE